MIYYTMPSGKTLSVMTGFCEALDVRQRRYGHLREQRLSFLVGLFSRALDGTAL